MPRRVAQAGGHNPGNDGDDYPVADAVEVLIDEHAQPPRQQRNAEVEQRPQLIMQRERPGLVGGRNGGRLRGREQAPGLQVNQVRVRWEWRWHRANKRAWK